MFSNFPLDLFSEEATFIFQQQDTYTYIDLRDPSTVPLNFTKSINLALSERGIHGLRDAGRPDLLDAVLKETLPMHGRMIHGSRSGELYEESQQYDAKGRVRRPDRTLAC